MEETKKEFTPRPERAERPQAAVAVAKVCAFCVDKVAHVDYKDAGKLKKYMSERGKDPAPPHDRYLRCSSASADRGYQACTSHCSSAVHRRVSNSFL